MQGVGKLCEHFLVSLNFHFHLETKSVFLAEMMSCTSNIGHIRLVKLAKKKQSLQKTLTLKEVNHAMNVYKIEINK